MTREEIEKAVKSAKWDKSSYAYAIGMMDVNSHYGIFYQSYFIAEIKDEFYRLCETRFDRIKDFKTFSK